LAAVTGQLSAITCPLSANPLLRAGHRSFNPAPPVAGLRADSRPLIADAEGLPPHLLPIFTAVSHFHGIDRANYSI